ncbi:unnamed protein product, partial [marine sediment metagenome]
MKTKILVLGLACLIFIFVFTLTPQSPSKSAFYFSEYTKAVANVHNLHVIFCVKVTSEQAESIVR